jgi:hypothetical protein
MANSRPPSGVLDLLVLYLVNISQPVREIDVARGIQASGRFSNWREDKILGSVRSSLAGLAAQNYLFQTPDEQYSLTYSGLQLLAERKMAFPRDKHRLYFLKEALRGRG